MQQDMKNELPQFSKGNGEAMQHTLVRVPWISKKPARNSHFKKVDQIKQGQNSKLRPYGLIIAFCFLVASGVTIYSGNDLAGGILALIPIFILAKYYHQKEGLTNSNDFNIN